MSDFDPHAYTVTVRRVRQDDDCLYSASVAELPDVEAFGSTYNEAYEVAIDSIENLHVLAVEGGEPFPPPAEYQQDYSGRITLRVPTYLHRKLALRAERESVSLNSLIIALLGEAVGHAAAAVSEAKIETAINAFFNVASSAPLRWPQESSSPNTVVSLCDAVTLIDYDSLSFARQFRQPVSGSSWSNLAIHLLESVRPSEVASIQPVVAASKLREAKNG